MKLTVFVLNMVSALAALFAAFYWYRSAQSDPPPVVAYWDRAPAEDPLSQSLRVGTQYNRKAALCAAVSALFMAFATILGQVGWPTSSEAVDEKLGRAGESGTTGRATGKSEPSP